MTIPSLFGIGSFIVGACSWQPQLLAVPGLRELSWSALVSFAWRQAQLRGSRVDISLHDPHRAFPRQQREAIARERQSLLPLPLLAGGLALRLWLAKFSPFIGCEQPQRAASKSLSARCRC